MVVFVFVVFRGHFSAIDAGGSPPDAPGGVKETTLGRFPRPKVIGIRLIPRLRVSLAVRCRNYHPKQ